MTGTAANDSSKHLKSSRIVAPGFACCDRNSRTCTLQNAFFSCVLPRQARKEIRQEAESERAEVVPSGPPPKCRQQTLERRAGRMARMLRCREDVGQMIMLPPDESLERPAGTARCPRTWRISRFGAWASWGQGPVQVPKFRTHV